MPSPVHTLDKALGLLRRLSLDRPIGFAAMTEGLGIAPSTAHRLIAALRQGGFLIRTGRDCYYAGHAIARAAGRPLPPMLLAAAAQPHLERLTKATGLTAQLGILDDTMVTYLAKSEPRGAGLFTREGMQLEAYCSAIGKVLLAALPHEACDRYLADGPFVAITANTITDPEALRNELARVRADGHADDAEEIQIGLRCVAVPLCGPEGIVAALSASGGPELNAEELRQPALRALRDTADALESLLFPA